MFRNNLFYATFLFVALCTTQNLYAQERDSILLHYKHQILESDIKTHIFELASDAYEGRETGKEGQKKAARYISAYFAQHGLSAPHIDKENPYYQPFELGEETMEEAYFEVGDKRYEFLKDFISFSGLPNVNKEVETVFVGFGLHTDSYSDYEKLDVEGKLVIALSGEPQKKDIYLLNGTNERSKEASNQAKAKVAEEKGAAGFLIFDKNASRLQNIINLYGSYFGSSQLGFPKTEEQENEIFLDVYISLEMAAAMLGKRAQDLQKEVDKMSEKLKPTSQNKGLAVKIYAEKSRNPVITENIIAFVEGTDKKDEVVVITAHYDHVGIIDGEIHNGADDDASGTVALMQLAKVFAQAKADGNGPRRTVAFIAMTGEEKGLLGSDYYSRNPYFPLENTVTNLNIDMIGRLDPMHEDNPDYVYIIGSSMLSQELHEISESMTKAYFPDFQLDYRYNSKDDPNRFYYRSDHYNFAKHDIPVIFYFNGVHEDYHKATDTADKIHLGKMEKISRVIFTTAWELANREQRPALNKPKTE
ncbi:MAG: M28 family peptidase [Bernardetiaceae bacterium]|nr:M28 family peptidase [Bernardetiaceae bacterium]